MSVRKQPRYAILMAGALFLPLMSGGLASASICGASSTSSPHANAALVASNQSAAASVVYALDIQLHEHAALATPALQAQLRGEPNAAAVALAVDNNSQMIANSVEQLYPGTHDQFLQLWRAHIDYYKQYLAAASNNDQAGKDQAKQNLGQFVNSLTALLGTANPHINKGVPSEHLTIHGNQTLAIIDALVADDYTTVYRLSNEAYVHMTMVAEAMAPKYNP